MSCGGDQPQLGTLVGTDAGDSTRPPKSVEAGDVTGGAADGPAIDSTGGDAALPADSSQGCDPNAEFGTPILVPGRNLNGPFEQGGPKLTSDELTIYFSSRIVAGGNSGLYVAHRSSASAVFDTSIALTSLDPIPNNDFDPTTLTELTLFFSSDRAGGLGTPGIVKDIWTASRASTADGFGTLTVLAAPINSTSDDATPFLRADGTELWFSSNRPGLGLHDIYRASISDAGIGMPVLVPEISTACCDDYTPTISADGLVIFFSSNRSDMDGDAMVDQDIWSASRAQVTDPFSNLRDVTFLNSTQDDYAGWLSADGCRLYMSSKRDGGVEKIYYATRGM